MMRMGRVAVVVLIASLALNMACAQGNLPQPVQAAVADLAQRLGIGQDAVTVASFEEVTWPDAALGAPEPGRIYAQVQTPGYRVFLNAEGRRYEYHTDSATRVVQVGSQETADTGPAGETVEQETRARLGVLWQVKQQLARRLGIEPGEVYVGAVEERTWPSTALGVERPGEMYAQVMTPGYRLVLEARGILYDYHTDMSGQAKPAGIVEPGGTSNGGGGQAEGEAPVGAAVSDLAERLNLAPDAITVANVEQVQWPDSAMGLPEPGMMYTQALVPGYRIILQALGREFAYHTDEHQAVRYAGVVYPADASVSVLAMSLTEPADGNNFFHLQRIDPASGQRETVVEFVSDFAATPDGRDIVIKRRTSRSGHVLVHVAGDGTTTELRRAFDFHGTAVRPDGQMVAFWARPSVADRQARLNIRMQPWAETAPIEPEMPGIEAGEFTTGMLAWTNDGLAFTVRTDTGAHSFYWTPDGGTQRLDSFAVMGWIPRTRALLIRRAQDNREILATYVPGSGETSVLANVPAMQSVDAPAGEEWVVAAVSDGGAPEIQRISWGGAADTLRTLVGTDSARVRISPVGGVAVAEYLQGDVNRVDVIDLEGDVETETLTDAAGALPVVD